MSATITIAGRRLSIDIERELAEYDWSRAIWLPDKLLAVSPFRYDRLPSFYVYLTDTAATARAGDWGDSGADDPEWQRGGFVKLLAFLRDETEWETRQYLLDKYAYDSDGLDVEAEDYRLHIPELTIAVLRRPLDSRVLDKYTFRSPYLAGRGISEAVQRLMSVGYDKQRCAVTMPWFNADGTLANIKYRRTDSKVFWYYAGGRPIRELVYGIDVIYSRKIRKVAIVEAEVDAMTFMTEGIPAIATGGSAFNEIKRDLIIRSPIEEVIVCRDNDAAGRKWQRKIVDELRPHMGLKIGIIPNMYKDVNEAHTMVNISCIVERARALNTLRIPIIGK